MNAEALENARQELEDKLDVFQDSAFHTVLNVLHASLEALKNNVRSHADKNGDVSGVSQYSLMPSFSYPIGNLGCATPVYKDYSVVTRAALAAITNATSEAYNAPEDGREVLPDSTMLNAMAEKILQQLPNCKKLASEKDMGGKQAPIEVLGESYLIWLKSIEESAKSLKHVLRSIVFDKQSQHEPSHHAKKYDALIQGIVQYDAALAEHTKQETQPAKDQKQEAADAKMKELLTNLGLPQQEKGRTQG